jgi:hypothetical protein
LKQAEELKEFIIKNSKKIKETRLVKAESDYFCLISKLKTEMEKSFNEGYSSGIIEYFTDHSDFIKNKLTKEFDQLLIFEINKSKDDLIIKWQVKHNLL